MPENALVRRRCTPSQMDEIFLEAPFWCQVLVLVRSQPEPAARLGHMAAHTDRVALFFSLE
jgi:hypothetical protein